MNDFDKDYLFAVQYADANKVQDRDRWFAVWGFNYATINRTLSKEEILEILSKLPKGHTPKP